MDTNKDRLKALIDRNQQNYIEPPSVKVTNSGILVNIRGTKINLDKAEAWLLWGKLYETLNQK